MPALQATDLSVQISFYTKFYGVPYRIGKA